MSFSKIVGRNFSGISMPLAYFTERNIFLDCRGPLTIERSTWGWECMVLTKSHDISSGVCGPQQLDKPVIVRAGAWIGSRAILYNCTIEAGAIVGAGAVVKGMTVHSGEIVEGNPARVTRRFVKGKWVKI